MTALAFWKAVVQDKSNFLERVVDLLDAGGIRYCAIGGVAVNAYVDPVVTLDLDIVIATDDLARARNLLAREFRTHEFEHSFNVYDPGSKLQVQLQLDPELSSFVDRAERREVLDLSLPVAVPTDLMRAKVAAALEPKRIGTKRQKDLTDILRLLEAYPELRALVPDEILGRLFL
ncbi:MAG: hypothetical protein IT303_13890 [Dehalococcoidia bacterium]|nr:hypothetical protein [Dehalococcoidia bacterium]